ncbi:MAG: hypothetical protein IKW30_06710 [Lachnospiraceae bacterium]|nr:hypothetical protein [Lachnospiraceae bacterium]
MKNTNTNANKLLWAWNTYYKGEKSVNINVAEVKEWLLDRITAIQMGNHRVIIKKRMNKKKSLENSRLFLKRLMRKMGLEQGTTSGKAYKKEGSGVLTCGV